MHRTITVFLVILIFCFTTCISGCVAPPKGDVKPTPMPTGIPSHTGENGTKTTTGESSSVTATPITIITIETPSQQPTLPFTANATTEPSSTPSLDTYVVIYDETIIPRYNITAVSLNLTNPPLLLNYELIPRMITDEKWYVSRNTTKAEVEVTVTAPSSTSWFRITIYDKKTRQMINQNGFGREFSSSSLTGQMKVYKAGVFLIEMEGNDIVAAVNISVKERGNIIPF